MKISSINKFRMTLSLSNGSNFKFQIITLLMAYGLWLMTAPTYAAELHLGIEPPILKIEALPPASVEAPITIQNLSDTKVALAIILKPFTAKGSEDGQVAYTEGPDPTIFQYIQIRDGGHSLSRIALSPSQQKTLTLQAGIPATEQSADYYFSVIFVAEPSTDEDQSSQSLAAGGIGTNVLLSIGPFGKAKGYPQEFSTPFLIEKGPVSFTVRIANTGSHVIAPTGFILIQNMFGQAVGKVELLPVNILAGTTRSIPDSLQNPESTQSGNLQLPTSNFSPPKALWHESFLLGPYSAKLNIALSEEGPVYSKTIRFIAFPYTGALGLVITLIITLIIRNRLKQRLQ